MICPKCGENNSENFRFCGMCGTPLEAPRPTAQSPIAAPSDPAQAVPGRTVERVPARAQETHATPSTTSTLAGPSFLGLDDTASSRREKFEPTFDLLREKSFSGFESLAEPERQANGRRVVLLFVLLAALGFAGWWTYSNYVAASTHTAPGPVTDGPAAGTGVAQTTSPAPEPPAASTPPASAAPAAADTPQSRPNPASSQPPNASEDVSPPIKPAEQTSSATLSIQPSASQPKTTASKTIEPKATPPAPAADDKGDALFRKGEAFLYGRGAAENCDEAVKYLKAASAKQNARARSAFGTMYATGHCVSRDLPTSYSWFALALRADPNNPILEKDLSAIWNQMTPPERQLATRANQ